MSKNRGRNEGTIYRRADGAWSAQISVEGKRLSKYFKTRKEASNWLLEMRNKLKSGISLAGAQTTLSEYFVDYLKAIQTTIRPNTHSQYSQIVKQHILPMLGKIKLDQLKPNIIQQLYSHKLDQGASERTVLLIHAVLHRALRQAVMWGILGWNPSDGVIRPKLRRTEMQVLDDLQVRNLLLAAKGNWMETFLQIAVTTGLRFGEILGLKWSDLDWETRRLQIQRQANRVASEGILFSQPKTKAGRRTVVLGTKTIILLREHWLNQQREIPILSNHWQDYDLIFPSITGTPMDQSNVRKGFKNLLKIAGLPNIRFHDLRHTAATLMLKQGINPKIVQERLGHADISLTLNTYSHVLPSMQEDAAEKIDELLTMIEVGRNLQVKESIAVQLQ